MACHALVKNIRIIIKKKKKHAPKKIGMCPFNFNLNTELKIFEFFLLFYLINNKYYSIDIDPNI
jgi:hypothetical protein